MRTLLPLIVAVGLATAVHGAPVVVDLPERATVRTTIVTVGDVARLSGGDAASRERIAALDLADLPARGAGLTVSRRAVEYRLRLAGFDPPDFQVVGAERIGITAARRALSAEEVVAAARAELLRLLPADGMTAELARPLVVKLPEVPAGETVSVQARPHGPVSAPGKVQMDVTLSAGGERLLAFALLFDVKGPATPHTLPSTTLTPTAPGPIVPATAVTPVSAGEVLVKARQRVRIVARAGALSVTAVGEAMQDGRAGQAVQVQNVDSKKILTARVTGPAAVEVELGGVP
jgi:flagella basal body P-ring formation protein FlgA